MFTCTKSKKNKKMRKLNSASIIANPLNQDVVLVRVLAYLPGQVLLISRLVCRQWNAVALSIFPEKLWFGAHRNGKVKFDLNIRILERKLLSSIQLYNGTSVRIDNYEGEDGCSYTTYADIKACLQFSHVADFSDNIREIKVHFGQEMDEISRAANRGQLCNLQTLWYKGDIHMLESSIFLKATSLPKLRKLKQFGTKWTSNEGHEKLFYQAMVDAVPSLQFFIKYWTKWDLDLRGCKNLTHLEIATNYEDDSTFMLFRTLNQVKGTLEKLKITRFFAPTYTIADWRKTHSEKPFPVFLKLKSLEIQESNQSKKNLSGLDFSIIFPKLERLSAVVCTEKREDALISRYLTTVPMSLTVLETTCCDRNFRFPDNSKKHGWINHLVTCLLLQLPNLKRFRVSSRCIFSGPGSGGEDEGKELLNLLCNLDFPHLIVTVKEQWLYYRKKRDIITWWNVPMFSGISSVAVSDCHGRKGGVLEFQKQHIDLSDDDTRKFRHPEEGTQRGYNEVDPEYDAALISFVVGLEELSKKWKIIKFKPVLMTRERIKKVEESIKERDLPVQLYYAFKQELV